MKISNDFLKLMHEELENRKKIEELKNSPLEASEVREIILKSDLDDKDKHRYIHEIVNLKKSGLSKDDYVPTFEEFSVEAEAEGKYPIEMSTFKHMTSEEQRAFLKVTPAFYNDVAPDSKIIHYNYKDTNGVMQKTGDGLGVIHHNSQNPELILEKTKYFGDKKTTIKKVIADIDVRGDKFTAYMKGDK